MQVRAVLFDLDDTLLDGSGTQEAILRTCRDIASAQPELDAAQLMDANREVWQGYWPKVEVDWTLGRMSGRSVSREAWRRTLRACGRDDDTLAELATQTLRRHQHQTHRPFGEVDEALHWLKSRFLLAVITNGASDTQRDHLRILGMKELFDALVISGEVGIAKPDARIFDIALQRLDVEAESAWHVGDSLMTDVAGAKAAGLGAVWLNRAGVHRHETDPEPDHEIRTLKGLVALLGGAV